ncbi:hypothetical protein ACSBR1_019798 [Camellia fascicularis]
MCVNFMFAGNNRYEEDPIAKRSLASPQRNVLENKDVAMANDALQTVVKTTLSFYKKICKLFSVSSTGKRNERIRSLRVTEKVRISVSLSSPETQIIDELEDREFLELASRLIGENVAGNEQISHSQAAEVVRDHWRKSTPQSIQLKELSPLLCDYQP